MHKLGVFALLSVTLLGGCLHEMPSSAITSGVHVCKDGDRVTVAGREQEVTVTGPCSIVTITGSKNKIVIASAKSVDIDGPENQVSVAAADAIQVKSTGNSVQFSKGLTIRSPAVIALGDDNQLVQTR